MKVLTPLLKPLLTLLILSACVNNPNTPGSLAQENPVNSAQDNFDPTATCLLSPTHPDLSFRIQCQALATLYLGFKVKGTEQILDLKDKQIQLVIENGQELFNSDSNANPLNFKAYETAAKKLDSHWLWITLGSQPLETFTISVEVAGYKPLSQKIEAFQDKTGSSIPDLLLELEPIE